AVANGVTFGTQPADSGFWMIKEYCNLSVRDVMLRFNGCRVLMSLTGLGLLLVAEWWLGGGRVDRPLLRSREGYSMTSGKPLNGRVGWVTGSSRGWGGVRAARLCGLGASVAIHGTRFDSPKSFGEGESMEQVARDVAAEAGGRAMPVWGDVTDEAEVKR